MIKYKNIVHFTHHDLDALGCMLHLDIATPNSKKTHFHTNYLNMQEKVSDVYDYCYLNKPDLLIISDISFSTNKNELYKLQEILDICPIIFIDHHEYEENFFDDIRIPYFHDITKSATKITQEVFKTKGKNKNLDALSDIINSFDIWLQNESNFKVSMALNDYFWTVNEKLSLENMMFRFKENDYKPPNFKTFFEKYNADFKQKYESFKKRKLITSDGFFAVCFVDEYFNEILYEEFTKGVEFVFIANSYGITRFRFNSFGKLTRPQKEEIKLKLIGTLNIGHLNAFSDKIQNSNFDKIMNKVKEVHNILEQYKGK